MLSSKPIIFWFRRDFRLAEHAAILAASQSQRPVIPVVLLDEVAETYGAASKWRLSQAIEQFEHRLKGVGSRLILRRGTAAEELLALARETGAEDIWWTRAYDPDAIARDTKVKSTLKDAGFKPRSWPGHLLFEPWGLRPSSTRVQRACGSAYAKVGAL